MSHPQHPNCSACRKALFKSAAAAKVKPSDPYAFCRNPACAEYTFRNDRPTDPKKPTPEQLAKAVRISGKASNGLDGKSAKTVSTQKPKQSVKVDHSASLKAVKEADKIIAITPAPEPASEPAPKTVRINPKPVSARGVPRRAVPISEAPAKPKESEPLAKARTRLRAILEAVTVGQPKESISLVLAILNQETGNQKAAEALIDEFKLDEKYGLLKFT